MRYVRSDIHQVSNVITAFPFCITFEKFSYLEEQHDKYGLRELCLRPREEANQ